ncbi:hypothetical protein AN958_10449 [Leucoagaricus sp. SymC.cos]|nr:hypothetical protein AN958_10447 [Leucoagaricus sp. SymC.cos]KXN86147.1 hypothetical protein AN958_10449 [Leucoagaricus sp. SymC.cos]
MAAAVFSATSKAVSQGGPSKLSLFLAHLNQEPKLQLHNVTSLEIRWNAKNNGFGARHFVKDALPRIRWANPSLDIQADKVWTERVKQRIELIFASGQTRTIEMDERRSTDIIKEVMDLAGGEPWRAYKKRREEEGEPILPGGEKAYKLLKAQKTTAPPVKPRSSGAASKPTSS